MIRSLTRSLVYRKLRSQLRCARQARAQAIELQRDAKRRHDDRDYGRATMMRKQAQHDCLALELKLAAIVRQRSLGRWADMHAGAR